MNGPARAQTRPSGRGMDTSLVMRAQRGDEEAFASLAVAVGDRLHAVAHRILRDIDLAEDATQQALLAIWRDLPSSAIRRASTPGRIGSSCAPATPRDAEATTGRRTCTCLHLKSRCRRMAPARS